MPGPARSVPARGRSDAGLAWSVGAPAAFVLLWSTGFVFAKWVLPYAPPMTFVALRFAIAAVVLAAFAIATRASLPSRRQLAHSAVVGVLLHAGYVGAVFASIDHGIPAGLSALVVGLQPVLSACVVGPWLGERVARMQWAGLVVGFAGVAVVLSHRLDLDGTTVAGLLLSLLALGCATVGTLYQKRYCADVDVRSGGVAQFAGAAVVSFAFAAAFETMEITVSAQLVGALTWFVLVLSLGAVSLLMLLIRHGAIARTTSLFYLVPPVTVLWAWLWFGEPVGAIALAGIALTAAGVWLVQRGGRAPG
jgi:drug/metabolite transporter (DMT)-like permease